MGGLVLKVKVQEVSSLHLSSGVKELPNRRILLTNKKKKKIKNFRKAIQNLIKKKKTKNIKH